jgi:hypothetical protein
MKHINELLQNMSPKILRDERLLDNQVGSSHFFVMVFINLSLEFYRKKKLSEIKLMNPLCQKRTLY